MSNHPGRRRGAASSLAVFACLLLAGCVVAEQDGDRLVITYAGWLLWGSGLLAAACLLAGGLLWWKGRRAAAVASAVLGVIAGGLFLPGMATDRLLLTDQAMFEQVGWFGGNGLVLRFENVERVQYHEKRHVHADRGDTYTYYVTILDRKGRKRSREIGTLWHESRDAIDAWMEARGIRVGIDPRAYGLRSDDPFVVSLGAGEARLDEGSARQRLRALVMSGRISEATQAGRADTLGDLIQRGEVPAGTWQIHQEDGPRWIRMEVDFGPEDRFEFRAFSHASPEHASPEGASVSLGGTFSARRRGLVLRPDGAQGGMLELLLPEAAGR